MLSLFCGIEKLSASAKGSNDKMIIKQNESESRRRVEKFYSLNRSKFEKYILDINLVLILLIATGLYIFFSLPHKLLHFNNNNYINLNSTSYSEI